MDILFLGTGGAWAVPELNCDCRICAGMRRAGESRGRSAFLLSRRSNLLVDCGPDIRSQLMRNRVDGVSGVLISHEHGDHYMGMDELFAFRRNSPRDHWRPIPVFMTRETWEVVRLRFDYLEQMGVIRYTPITPGEWFSHREWDIYPFKTEHGAFAKGSVGFMIRWKDRGGRDVRLVYTSDFMDIPGFDPVLASPDWLIIQSFWLNEPAHNRPHHMSFQRALQFIRRFAPVKGTFLVHMGDADMVPGDPANINTKKYAPRDPLRPAGSEAPYPIPLNQAQWQRVVERILADRDIPCRVRVAYDDLRVRL
ncbi:MAG: hypothetical protein DRH56_04620 [Deltaproteobacteria bacterium]|nr:MAG: hypothetical protein DRH56_04620 [Deltaproteobacteria bacterium]